MPISESGAETTARQAAATTLETNLATVLTNITSYLNAGSGDSHEARGAVKKFVAYKLQTLGLHITDADRGGFTNNSNLSAMTLVKEG